ncbi:MAG: hypothetical protein AAF399_13115, partial [Bacteroidota bacterium]
MNPFSLLVLSLICLGLVQPIQAQNPFKKLEKVIREQVGLPNPPSSESEKSAEAESSAEGAGEENPSQTPFPWGGFPHDDSTGATPPTNPFGEGSSVGSDYDASLFEPSVFSSLPVTELGTPGKGPFAMQSGMIIYEKTIENAQMNGIIHDTLFFDDFGWKQVRYTPHRLHQLVDDML